MAGIHNRKLVITGASGLLGNEIVELAKNDYVLQPLHNTNPLHPNSRKLDIANPLEVMDLLARFKPDWVVHTASETNVDKCESQREHAWKVNVEGTRNIAIACKKTNSKLICISTDYVFDGKRGNYKECDKPNPVNYYGVTKLEAEKEAANHCPDFAILRTSVLYGWHPTKLNFATWIVNQLKHGKEISVVEDHYNTPTYARNLAEMIMESIRRDLQGVYHASGSERISRCEFAKQVAEAFNLDPHLIKPTKMNQLTTWKARRPSDSSLNTDKIQKQLKAKPLDITEGLNKMREEVHK